MSTLTLNEKVKELRELQRMAEELEAEMEAIKDELKSYMISAETEEIITTEYKIRYKEVITNRFDSTAFKTKYNDLYNQFLKTTTTMRFSIA